MIRIWWCSMFHWHAHYVQDLSQSTRLFACDTCGRLTMFNWLIGCSAHFDDVNRKFYEQRGVRIRDDRA